MVSLSLLALSFISGLFTVRLDHSFFSQYSFSYLNDKRRRGRLIGEEVRNNRDGSNPNGTKEFHLMVSDAGGDVRMCPPVCLPVPLVGNTYQW